ncbi:ankyrin repeat domain-containing protein [Shewanella sp. C32]|uniref:Ankyrin repeat domain-containing protein n=1 Tax=Shewanella electrica TaxID=515560 RepID=A0ABT2FHT2_9GAMM|nr:ankyrin repeat domain-containing protein [Shewanella electrica]MCH1923963.1 ankyrin repeat domain-containing protein [Shewanella electrica]MCS4555866.1 ankyrin repeat domain-containing protein [Shewanella electrica]
MPLLATPKRIFSLLLALMSLVALPSSAAEDWLTQDENGQTLLHRIFDGSAWRDKRDIDQQVALTLAFNKGEIDPNLRDKYGYTAAHYAIKHLCVRQGYDRQTQKPTFATDLSLVTLLLKQPQLDPNIRDNYYRSTPLMLLLVSIEEIFRDGCYQRVAAATNALLTHQDLRLNYRNNVDHTLATLLDDWAHEQRFQDHFKQLLAEHQIDVAEHYDLPQSRGMWNTLNNAVNDGRTTLDDYDFYEKAVVSYLAKNADPSYAKDRYPALALVADARNRPYGTNVAVNNQLRAKLSALLLQHGADINDINDRGESVFAIALQSKNLPLVKVLLASPTLEFNTQDNQGNTPIMSYISYQWSSDNFAEMMALLQQHQQAMDMSIKNYQGQTLADMITKVRKSYNKAIFKAWDK